MSEAGGNVSSRQSAFYGRLYSSHGEGVDAVASGNQAYKELRYEKLCKLFSGDRSFSLHDVGCGIGHLRDYLDRHHAAREIAYSGPEITIPLFEHTFCVYKENPIKATYRHEVFHKYFRKGQ